MATDARGHTVPDGTSAPHRGDLLDLSLSTRDIVYVGNVTARATAATALGASATNPVYTHRADASAGRELEVTVDGVNWRTINAEDSGWQSATLGTGWTNAAGYTTRFRLIAGIVYLNGMVVRGASAGAAFFTLPVGYRPSQAVVLGSFLTSGVGGASYDLFADTTGTVGFASSGYVSGTTGTGTSHPVGGSFPLG